MGRGQQQFELISVTFNAPPRGTQNYSFSDTRTLFEFGYRYFQQTELARVERILSEIPIRYARGTNHLSLMAAEPVVALIPRNTDESDVVRQAIIPDYLIAPIERGTRIGEMEFLYNGNVVGRVELLAANNVERHTFWWFFMATDFVWSFLWFRITVYVLLGMLLLWILLVIWGVRKAVKRSRRRNYRSYRNY